MTDYGKWFDDAIDESPVALSPDATVRREAMRARLCEAVTSRRRRRAAVRGAIAATLIAGLAFAAWPERTDPTQPNFEGPVHVADASLRMEHAEFEVVHDSDDILARFAPPPRALAAEIFIDDDQLLQHLHRIDRPATLLRTADRVVVYPEVADPLGD